MLLHSLKKSSLLPLLAAVALASACRSEPEAPPEAPVVAPAEPAWTPTPSSPRYAVGAGADGAPQLLDGKGQLLLSLGLSRDGRYGEAEGEGGCAAEGLCLRDEQGALEGWKHAVDGEVHSWTATHTGEQARLEATWRLRQGDPRARLTLKLTYTTDATPDREAVTLRLPGEASLLDETLRFVRPGLTGGRFIGPWTPHRVISGEGERALHVAALGMQGMEVQRAGGSTEVTLELDDARNHPLRIAGPCDGGAALRARDRAPRKQGDTVEATVEVWIGHTWAPVEHRYPKHFLAALSVIDDAATEPAHLRALLRGYSDPKDARYGNGGFLGHELPLTLALQAGPRGFGRPDNAAIVREARDLGVAVANLGPAAEDANEDAVLEAGIESLREVRTRLWIDPSPARRCQGPLATAQPRLASLLAEQGYTLIEAPSPASQPGGDLNQLPGRAALAWGHPALPPALHLLHTTGGDQPGSWRDLDSAHLQRLLQERGAVVLRSHIGTTAAGGGLQADGAAIRPSGDLEKRLFDLNQEGESGDLWITTPADLLTHLRAVEAVRIEPLADGTWRLTLPQDAAPLDLTLWLPGGAYGATLAGKPLPAHAITGPSPAALVTAPLQPGKPTLLQIVDAQGRHVQPLIPVQWTFPAP